MTTDIERELRELFRDKAGEAPVSTLGTSGAPPPQVLRRGRRRQVGTVLGSALVAFVLAVGSFAGLRSLLRSDEDPFQTGQYEVFERTATIEAFTVGSPSDWYLVNQWPLSMLIAVEGSSGVSSPCPADLTDTCQTSIDQTSSPIPVPHGLPMFQLSNVDLGLTTNACADGLPEDGAVLYVALDAHPPVGGDAPPIPEFPPGIGLPSEGDGACGPGRYAHFKVNGEPLFAWIGIGSGVSDEDRETVETSYEMMSAIPDWELAPPDQTTPAYVVAGGSADAGEYWRLELRPDGDNVDLTLVGGLEEPSTEPFEVPSVPIEWAAVDPIFGAITKEATGAEFQLFDGSPAIPGSVVPLPPSMPFDFDLFFIEGTAGLEGEVVALGFEDQPTQPPVAQPRGDEVELAGDAFGQRYRVRFTGAFADDTACIHVMVGGERSEPSCPRPLETSLAGIQPSMHGVTTTQLNLLAGSVSPEVVEIRFTSDDGTDPPTQFRCQMGPLGWTAPDRKVCVMALPPEGSGIFAYLDADGDVLFEEGMGWFVSQAEEVAPLPVDPVHGGTYWGVYAWLGPAGAPEANDVIRQLFEEHGVQAYQGELACDRGAAEALGQDAAWKVAVYFETERDANTFASRVGFQGMNARTSIAQVTTYCLD